MKLPTFFLVGEPKCGTTALYEFLKQHPQLYLPEQKELHYFSKDLNAERLAFHKTLNRYYNHDFSDYIAHYEAAGPCATAGDCTPQYLASRVAADEIFAFNPEARIIAVFRDPVDLLYSEHAQVVATCNETENDFEKALDLEPQRRQGVGIPRGVREPSQLFYSEKIRFAEHLERFIRRFPVENIQVILFEDFRRDNRATYRRLLTFLGVDPSFGMVPAIHNEGRVCRFPQVMSSYNSLARLGPAMALKRVIPLSLLTSLRRGIRWLTFRTRERPSLDPLLRVRLREKYLHEVVALNALLHQYGFLEADRDLRREWGYAGR